MLRNITSSKIRGNNTFLRAIVLINSHSPKVQSQIICRCCLLETFVFSRNILAWKYRCLKFLRGYVTRPISRYYYLFSLFLKKSIKRCQNNLYLDVDSKSLEGAVYYWLQKVSAIILRVPGMLKGCELVYVSLLTLILS